MSSKSLIYFNFGASADIYMDPSDNAMVKKYSTEIVSNHRYFIMREISILRQLNAPEIIKLHDIKINNKAKYDKVSLILENGGPNLRQFINSAELETRIKYLPVVAFKLIKAVRYLHAQGIMHRDITSLNILFNPLTETLKLCDFGLSRASMPMAVEYSPHVYTMTYRPPELLVKTKNYGCEIDIWAVACVLLEIWLGENPFNAKSEINILMKILNMIPTTQADLNNLGLDIIRLESCNTTNNYIYPFGINGNNLGYFGDLVEKMLRLSGRITAEEAICHPYFSEFERPSDNAVEFGLFLKRMPLTISNQMRNLEADKILFLDRNLNDQICFIAINIMDQYLMSFNHGVDEVDAIALCSVSIANEYINGPGLIYQTKKYDSAYLNQLTRKILCKIKYIVGHLTLLDMCQQLNIRLTVAVILKLKDIIVEYRHLVGKDRHNVEKILKRLF